ncbi:hypothetical protein KAZ01_03710 [Candidatus Gracilibacteria bacterium]|nr:hypothetical protein [Candidatus Gracilibacteria bacterium]
MKILYVEDDLIKHISSIRNLFRKYLTQDIIEKLKDINSGKTRANKDKVKEIIESCNMIDVCFTFPDALDKIINNYEDYALFVVDRNLSESSYNYDDLIKIDDKFRNKEELEKINKREGDYLFRKIAIGLGKIDEINDKFYFFSAYEKDSIVKEFIDEGKYTESNFIEKGKKEQEDRLNNIIEKIPVMNLIIEYKKYINIIRERISKVYEDYYISVLSKMSSDKLEDIKSNLDFIRDILVKLLENIMDLPSIQSFNNEYKFEKNNNNLNVDALRRCLETEIYKTDTFFITKFIDTIYRITSSYGSHGKRKISEIKFIDSNTVKSLVFALNNIIIWSDDFIKNNTIIEGK